MAEGSAARVIPVKQDDGLGLDERLSGIISKELVVGFAGPIGCQIDTLKDELVSILKSDGYIVHEIKISSLIEKLYQKLPQGKKKKFQKEVGRDFGEELNLDSDFYDRVTILQSLGNFFRQEYEKGVLAQSAISEISVCRMKSAKITFSELDEDFKEEIPLAAYTAQYYKPPKIAYLISQLKNPSEVKLLRNVYSDIFYLVGLIEKKDRRIANLKSMMKSRHPSDFEAKAVDLERKDKSQDESHGQQLEKTLQMADYFVYGDELNREEINSQIDRFFSLSHSQGVITPTIDEYGMYAAYSAALKSACLSRQVGAAIVDEGERVLATGCNDVPKFGGGLYSTEPREQDKRCYLHGEKCYNDSNKKEMLEKLKMSLEASGLTLDEKVLLKAFKDSGMKDLIEFSRAVHAEMDAIISVARSGKGGLKGATLYSTTFPCHNCARHIVTAGISRVVYVEPYEKSLAEELHDDSISLENVSDGKVHFDHFKGVAPRRFQSFFMANGSRKNDEGKYLPNREKVHQAPEYLESYRDIEGKVTKHLLDKGLVFSGVS